MFGTETETIKDCFKPISETPPRNDFIQLRIEIFRRDSKN
jgi:hypothetical protein